MAATPIMPFTCSYVASPRAQRLRDVEGDRQVQLTVVFRPRDLPQDVGEAITRAEYAARHATDATVLERFVAYVRSKGMLVVSISAAQHLMHLSGTYDQARNAFSPENLAVYGVPGQEFVSRHGHLSLPADLAPDIVAVMGFDQRPIAQPYIRIHPLATSLVASYDPVAVSRRYLFPQHATGQGQTIALIELGGGYDPAGMSHYFETKGVARTGTLESVPVGQATNAPGDPSGADGEVQLDIEVAGSVAPAANIAVYFGSNQGSGFLNAVAAAVHDSQRSPSVISISWGGPESGWPAQDIDALNQAFQAAATLGITVCCASGDSGAVDGSADGKPTVDFPASSPFVLGCGGTRLPPKGPEVAWNDGTSGGASGGGYSVHFPRPAWQLGAGKGLQSKGGRGVPDVSGDADPATGYNVIINGQSTVVGGTSAVAPLWAGLVALSNQMAGHNAGFINPVLYANPAVLTDVTKGNNISYRAIAGWDAVTGLGTPLGGAIATLLGGKPALGKSRQSEDINTA